MNKKVLITGGAGYIGSCIAGALLDSGYEPVILDSMVNGYEGFTLGYPFYRGDIADKDILSAVIKDHGTLYGAVHCAAHTVIPESVEQPELYYRENVMKSMELYNNLRETGCSRILLSGSASVYGDSDIQELSEKIVPNPGSPYARTKLMQEYLLMDYCNRSNGLPEEESAERIRGITLRYFNPLGADPAKRSGPYKKKGSHLIARLLDHSPENPFTITGDDYPTRDGSGLRDYFHIGDLAAAHVAVMDRFDQLMAEQASRYLTINIGSGNGVTVFEFLKAFNAVSGREIPRNVSPRRPGDITGGFAVIDRARELLGWEPQYTLEEAIQSAIEWELPS